jgi:hypothetical protein
MKGRILVSMICPGKEKKKQERRGERKAEERDCF